MVLAHNLAALVQKISLGIGLSGVALQKGGVVPVRHEADVLAVVLPGGDKAVFFRYGADLGLGQFPQGEEGVLQHILGQAVEKIGLILGLICGLI